MANMQLGGWYNHNGKNQRYWGSYGWTDGSDPTQGASQGSSPTTPNYSQDLQDSVNKYIDQLKGQYGSQHDLMLKQLDTQHKLALGNNDQESAKFLESVADGLEGQIGRIPYDYQRYNTRELQNYALGNNEIAQNKQLALDKLANDEQALSTGQVQSNQNTAESLNSRGLLYGQAPTGGLQPSQNMSGTPQYLSGFNGLAGEQANQQNASFIPQWQNEALGKTGIQNQYGQQQSQLDFNHQNTMQDLTVDSRRGAQDANNSFQFGTQGANNDYNNQIAALERQKEQMKQQAQYIGNSLTGKAQGYS